ncbi:MAG: leucine-rich repeat protein [Bacteroidales bacterium]
MAILLFTCMGRAAAQSYDEYEIYEGDYDEANGAYYIPDSEWKEAEGGVISTYSGSVTFNNTVTFKLRKIKDYDEDGNPIYDYKEETLPLTKIASNYPGNPNVTGAYIPGNVIEIGASAFVNFTGLVSVTGCSGVEKIGYGAFKGCTALKNASFVKVKQIDPEAFMDCSALQTIGIGSISNQEIGKRAFDGCTALSSDISVTGIVGEHAFRNCEAITKVDISTTADSIGPEAFIGCSELETIEFNGNTKLRIGNRAFYGIKKVRTLQVGGISIGELAFGRDFYDKDLEGLESITFSPSVKIIGDGAFRYWGSLKHLDLGTSVEFIGNHAFASCGMEAIQFSPEVKFIDNYAFMECPNIKKLEIPKKTKVIGDMAFYECPKLTQVTITGGDSIAEKAFFGCTALTSIELGDSLRILGDQAFEGCTNIEGHIKFPKTLEFIGWKNFLGCRKITGIDLPDGLKFIGGSAFEGCIGITKLAIPARVEYIGTKAFYGCSSIKDNLVFPATLKQLRYEAFQNCIKLQSINLGSATALETIERGAFYNCKGIKGQVRIPDAVTTVEKEAFYSCDSINSLHIGASLEEIGEDAFLTFPWRNLTAITVSSSNPNYDSRDNCNAIIETATNKLYKGCMNTVIPESVTTIGKDAFISCGMYGTFNIPDAVQTIEDYAFFGCRTLDHIKLSEDNNLASIGMWAFRDCEDLKDALYLNSIDYIGFGAFQGCSKIPGIFFGSILRKIEAQAFLGCYNLQHVTFWAPAPPYVGNGAFHYELNFPMFIRCGSTAAFEEEMPEQKLFIEEGYYSLRAVSEDVEIGRVFITAPYSCETNEVTVAAVAEDGYKFAFWSDGCVLNPYTMTLTDDVSLVAYFTEHSELKYLVTAESNDSTKGSVTGGGSYIAQTTAELTAVPADGFEFLQWNDGNKENPRTFTVTQDTTFIASFGVIGAIDENNLSNVTVFTQGNNIVINNALGYDLSIYDLTGRLLVNETAITTNSLVLHIGRKGMYFVKVGKGKVQKVILK